MWLLPECIRNYSIVPSGGCCPCPVICVPLFQVMLRSCIYPTDQCVAWFEMTVSEGTPVGLRQTLKHVVSCQGSFPSNPLVAIRFGCLILNFTIVSAHSCLSGGTAGMQPIVSISFAC